jgi:hypothetical protein
VFINANALIVGLGLIHSGRIDFIAIFVLLLCQRPSYYVANEWDWYCDVIERAKLISNHKSCYKARHD